MFYKICNLYNTIAIRCEMLFLFIFSVMYLHFYTDILVGTEAV